MNKKFSTLVAGLALCTAFTANAKVENGKVYQLTNEDGKYLSVTESYTKTDSLILADAPTADIKNTDYQKSLSLALIATNEYSPFTSFIIKI